MIKYYNITDITKNVLIYFLHKASTFFDLSESIKLQYEYTGLIRTDGYAAHGYCNKDIERGGYKESFNFSKRSEQLPFDKQLVSTLIDQIDHIGYSILNSIDNTLINKHDFTLFRLHKYYPLSNDYYINTTEEITDSERLDKLRFFPHCDYGTLTLIYQFNDVKGLQYKDINWCEVPFNENQIIIMYGTTMREFGYEPTYHRLMNNDITKVRYSLSCHYDLKPEYLNGKNISERLGIKA